jgi:hypothetical protein
LSQQTLPTPAVLPGAHAETNIREFYN